MRRRANALVLTALGLLAGCAGLEPESGKPGPSEGAGQSTPPEEPTPPEPRDPAVRGLVADAERASEDGDHGRAVSLLERALRIQPQNAALWQNLAVVRYRQGRYDQAESVAERSNALAGPRSSLRRRNWALIEAARARQGDAEGAREARQQRESLTPAGGEP